MNLKPIRLRIIDLIDQHGDNFDKCPGCPACTEIEQLRKSLEREPEMKFKHILSKGQDMTRSDIALMIEQGVQRKVIKTALKMGDNEFGQLLRDLGLSRIYKTGGENEVGKITLAEYQDLKAKGLTDKQIAVQKDIHPNYLPALKKQWFKKDESPAETAKQKAVATIQKIKQPATVKTETKVPEAAPIQKPIQPVTAEEKKAPCNCFKGEEKVEYERLIAALRNDLNEAHQQLDEKDEKIRNLEYLHDAFEDMENELAAIRLEKELLERKFSQQQEEERESQEKTLIYRIQLEDAEKKLQEMEDEYQTLRWLVKKWA